MGGLNNNLTLAGVLAGSGSLVKTGTADVSLTGTNTFNGLFDVQSGSLTTVGNGALGVGAGVNLASGTSSTWRQRQPGRTHGYRACNRRGRQHLERGQQ